MLTLILLAFPPIWAQGAQNGGLGNEVYSHPEKPLVEATEIYDLSKMQIRNLIIERANSWGIDPTLALEIIRCESEFKPYAKHYNGTWSIDHSFFQINDYYHKESMLALGWDITVPEDNLEAGFYLLKTYGVQPWEASQHCWN